MSKTLKFDGKTYKKASYEMFDSKKEAKYRANQYRSTSKVPTRVVKRQGFKFVSKNNKPVPVPTTIYQLYIRPNEKSRKHANKRGRK